MSAKTLFLENGFSGTSIDAIAKTAGVAHGLVFHHFGNKEKLWVEVKQHISEQAEQDFPIIPNFALPFTVFLKKFIENCIHYYRDNPDLIRMIAWQRLEHKQSKKISVTLSRGMQKWMDVFVYFQQQGDINPTLKPEFIVTFFAAIVSSASMDRNIFIDENKELRAYIDFCCETLVNGLRA